MKKRWVMRLGALLAALTAAWLVYANQRHVLALCRGESYYQGKASSDWAQWIRDNPDVHRHVRHQGGQEAVPMALAGWMDRVKQLTGLGTPAFTPLVPTLREQDPHALPVLLDLLRNPDPVARGYAVECLGLFEPPPEEVLPALMRRLDDASRTYDGTPINRRAALLIWRLDKDATRATPGLMDLALGKGAAGDQAAEEAMLLVRGKVMLDGQPLSSGTITFHLPQEQFVGAKINGGNFVVFWVPLGQHAVTVQGNGVPERYAAESTTPVQVEVNRDRSPLVLIELRSRD